MQVFWAQDMGLNQNRNKMYRKDKIPEMEKTRMKRIGDDTY